MDLGYCWGTYSPGILPVILFLHRQSPCWGLTNQKKSLTIAIQCYDAFVRVVARGSRQVSGAPLLPPQNMSLETQALIFRYSIGLPTFKKQLTQNGKTVVRELLPPKTYLLHFLSMRQKFLELRNEYTLPYLFAGSRVLRCDMVPRFVPKIQEARNAWIRYRDRWLEDYPKFVAAESSESKPESLFPTVDHLRRAFSFRIGLSPLPGEGSIALLSAEESVVETLYQDFVLQREETIFLIKRSSAERINERVRNVVNVLSRDGQQRISERLVPSLMEECKRIASIAPVLDSRLANIIEAIEGTLNVPSETLRKNPSRKSAQLSAARNVEASLNDYIQSMQ